MRRLAFLIATIVLATTSAFAVEGVRSELVGTWSFDGSCASGDGMTLEADGTAGFDEWGIGLWYARELKTLYLILQEREPGVDEIKAIRLEEMRLDKVEASRLEGEMLSDGRKITAIRCPQGE